MRRWKSLRWRKASKGSWAADAVWTYHDGDQMFAQVRQIDGRFFWTGKFGSGEGETLEETKRAAELHVRSVLAVTDEKTPMPPRRKPRP